MHHKKLRDFLIENEMPQELVEIAQARSLTSPAFNQIAVVLLGYFLPDFDNLCLANALSYLN